MYIPWVVRLHSFPCSLIPGVSWEFDGPRLPRPLHEGKGQVEWQPWVVSGITDYRHLSTSCNVHSTPLAVCPETRRRWPRRHHKPEAPYRAVSLRFILPERRNYRSHYGIALKCSPVDGGRNGRISPKYPKRRGRRVTCATHSGQMTAPGRARRGIGQP